MLNKPKIINITPHNDYTLDIKLSNQRCLKLDMTKFLTTPAYKKLQDLKFFLTVKHNQRMIYWDDMHDMHIDQILFFATLS
jgi:hypothetical protein